MKIRYHKNTLFRIVPVILLLCTFMLNACGVKSTKSSNYSTGHKVAKTAHTQMGKKYLFGGESPSEGFDCSGLIWWAYKKHGISVPRVTKDQAVAGRSVSSKSAKPGDIVVFRTSNTTLHTGLYLGANKFIHSPRTGARIRIESIDNSYWKPKLRTVRRVVN